MAFEAHIDYAMPGEADTYCVTEIIGGTYNRYRQWSVPDLTDFTRRMVESQARINNELRPA